MSTGTSEPNAGLDATSSDAIRCDAFSKIRDTDANSASKEWEENGSSLTGVAVARRRAHSHALTSQLDSDTMSVTSNVTTPSVALQRGLGDLRLSHSLPSTTVRVEPPDVTTGISKFDILLMRHPTTDDTAPNSTPCWEFYTASTPSFHHVGNNRCHVVCQMHAADYAAAATTDRTSSNSNSNSTTEQDAVLDRVYTMVLHLQCVDVPIPRLGKFLVRRNALDDSTETASTQASHERYWTELTTEQARDVLRQCLAPPDPVPLTAVTAIDPIPTTVTTVAPPASLTHPSAERSNDNERTHTVLAVVDDEKKRRRRSSLLRRSVSMTGDVFGDEKKRVAMRHSVLLQLQNFDVSCSDEEEANIDDATYVTGRSTADKLEVWPSDAATTPWPVAETAATPIVSRNVRRSSLMASMPNMPGAALGSPIRGVLERSPSWSQGLDAAPEILTANALDVIFQSPDSSDATPTFYTLLANHTGNNRLLVMVQLRLSKYMSLVEAARLRARPSASDRVRQLCRELVDAVHASYKGRFLLEQVQDSGDTESYRLLTVEQAAAGLECIFQAEAAEENHVSATSVTKSMSSATPRNDTLGVANVGSMPVSLTRSMPAIPTTFNLGVGTRAVSSSVSQSMSGDVHRAAIESLQKRKKRQGVNNKISQMVAINTGNTSLLERSRSAGDAMAQTASVLTDSILPSPPHLAPHLARFGSTGQSMPHASFHASYSSLDTTPGEAAYVQQLPQTRVVPQHDPSLYEYQPMNNASVTWDSSVQDQQHMMEQQQMMQQQQMQYPQHQLQQQMGVCRRRSTLSEFSQGMIHDMLQRLESSNELYPDPGDGNTMMGYNQGMHHQANATFGAMENNAYASTQFNPEYPNQMFAPSGMAEGAGSYQSNSDAAYALGYGQNQQHESR